MQQRSHATSDPNLGIRQSIYLIFQRFERGSSSAFPIKYLVASTSEADGCQHHRCICTRAQLLRQIKIINGVKPVRQFFNGRGLNLSRVYSHSAYALRAFEEHRTVGFKSQLVNGASKIHGTALSL